MFYSATYQILKNHVMNKNNCSRGAACRRTILPSSQDTVVDFTDDLL
jgi:hypothetical protein